MKNPLEGYRERNREKLLSDFPSFCRRAWREIEPSKELQWAWFHELVAEWLQVCYEGETTRLIITMPPRALKSRLVSIFFPSWCWAKSPGQSFILVSYSDSLSEELNIVRRNLLTSRWFEETFGKIQFSADLNRREQFANVQGGHMIATSVEGTLTGKGSDYIICDDLLSPQQSYSDLERINSTRFFDSTLRSRLNSPTEGRIICISQRLHQSDLPGVLLENEPGVWEHVCLPMECEQDEEIVFPLSGRIVHRKQGDLLHPQRWPESWCKKTKSTIGSFLWSSQFQQKPGIAGGSIFRNEWFQEYDKLPERGRTIVSLDSAFSTRRTADYSAASVWLVHDGKYFLTWMWRGRVAFPELKKITENLYETWNPDIILVEEKGSGISLLQALKEETTLPVHGVQVDADKVSRAYAVTGLFESGRIYFPSKDKPWMADFLAELLLFPNSTFDDQVDCVTMALSYLRAQQ
jgi:predicted phage terminase large subunit-like protein